MSEEELKEKFETANRIAWDKWRDLPDNLDYAEYDKRVKEIFVESSELSREYRLIKTPVMKDADDFDKECLEPFDGFVACCKHGGFIDYDGSGEYGTATQKSGISIYPSDIKAGKYRKDFTHVYWYNK